MSFSTLAHSASRKPIFRTEDFAWNDASSCPSVMPMEVLACPLGARAFVSASRRRREALAMFLSGESRLLRLSPKDSADFERTARPAAPNMSEKTPAHSGK